MIRSSFLLLTMLAAGCLSPTGAAAASSNAKSLGKFGYWQAFKTTEAKDPVCYMALTAKPPVSRKTKLKRGDVTLMITHRPAERAFDVVSYAAGVKFKPGSDVTLQAEGANFNLFTQGDTAWSRDAATDKAVAIMLRRADSVTISGMSSSGKRFADAISMRGSAAAYKAISEGCGVAYDPLKEIFAQPAAAVPKKAAVAQKKTSAKKK